MIAGSAVDRRADLLLVAVLVLAVFVLRNPTLRAPWRRVVTRPWHGFAGGVEAFVLVGLLISCTSGASWTAASTPSTC